MRNMVGVKTGKLEVKEYSHYDGRHHYWRCLCECGNWRVYHSGNIARSVRSCGCDKKKTGRNHKYFKGCGDLSLALFHKWKGTANRRKILFEVSIEYLWELIVKQDFRCSLTGQELTLPKCTRDYRAYTYNISPDRIDSNIGYVEGNIQFVIKEANMMKQQLSQNRFLELCRLVVEHKGAA